MLTSSSSAGQANPPSWHVQADTPEGVGSLHILLNRSALTNDLAMDLTLWDYPESSLYLDLLTANMLGVSTNLYGNLLEGSDEVVQLTIGLPIATNKAASVIRLRRGAGEVAVYDLVLTEMEETGLTEAGGFGRTTVAQGRVKPGSSRAENPEAAGAVSARTGSGAAGDRSALKAGHGKMFYVDAAGGHDENDGFSAGVEGNKRGPKKTIDGALRAAQDGDSITIRSGTYRESSDFRRRGVQVYFTGTVFM